MYARGCSSSVFALWVALDSVGRAAGKVDVSAYNPAVRLVGRFEPTSSGPSFDMNGCEIQFRVHGAASVAIRLSQQVSPYVPGPLQPSGFQVNNFVAYIDGAAQTTPAKGSNCTGCAFDTSLGADGSVKTYPIAERLTTGVHEIRLVKATEPQWVARVPAPNWLTFHGLVLDAGEVLPPSKPRPLRRLEFVGDSITAGYCNLCDGPGSTMEPHEPTYGQRRRRAAEGGPWEELFTLAWPVRICEAFGAECHTSAWSGFGMIENCCGGNTTMPEIWRRTLATDASSQWNFSSWIPHGLVINLGTNDNVWARNLSYSETYFQMVLNASRTYGEHVHFFLACGPMENDAIVYCPYVQGVVARAIAAGLRAHFFDLRGFLNGSFGPACCGHPSAQVDAAMADYGVRFISDILGWVAAPSPSPNTWPSFDDSGKFPFMTDARVDDQSLRPLVSSFGDSGIVSEARGGDQSLGPPSSTTTGAPFNNICKDAFTMAPLEAQGLMLFAAGKPFFDQGAYWVCKNINQHKGLENFQTKHFTVTLNVHGAVPAEIGICLPSACRDEDIGLMLEYLDKHKPAFALAGVGIPSYSTAYPQPQSTVRHPNPVNDVDDLVKWSDPDGAPLLLPIFASFVLVLLILVCLSTSAMHADMLHEQHSLAQQSSRPFMDAGERFQWSFVRQLRGLAHMKIFKAFSLVGPNGTWTTLWQRSSRRPTDCLNGLRVISMFWIIIGHSFLITGGTAGYSNPQDVVKTVFNPSAAATSLLWPLLDLPGLDLSVDTFFFISGFLCSFAGANRPTPVLKGAIVRYVRLMPCLAFAMAFYVIILPYIVVGPFAPRFQNSVFRRCHAWGWWSPLLFVMNFVPWYNDDVCMGWTWYLGNDMIFTICGLALLSVWKRFPVAGWAATILICLASFGVTIASVFVYNLEIFAVSGNLDYQYYLYDKPWSRIPAFLVGFAIPWALRWAQRAHGLERGCEPRSWRVINTVRICVVLAVGSLLALLCVTATDQNGPFGSSRVGGNWSGVANAIYITFARPAWALGHAVITVACFFGYVPFVDGFLAHWLWTPLGRLTFNAYLWHPLIINLRCAVAVQYYQFSTWMVLQNGLTDCVMAYAVSIFAWCLVEKPVATLTGDLLKSA